MTLFGGASFKLLRRESDAECVLDLLFHHNVNRIDTAHGYGGDNSETLIGGRSGTATASA